MQVIDQPGLQILAHRRDTTADANVEIVGNFVIDAGLRWIPASRTRKRSVDITDEFTTDP